MREKCDLIFTPSLVIVVLILLMLPETKIEGNFCEKYDHKVIFLLMVLAFLHDI